jgi:beta-phosphoglucomutase
MKRAFIFDMDGTIVDNMAYHTASWIEFFKRRGQTIAADEFFLRTAGRHGRAIMRDYIRADLSDAESDALADEKELIYRELYAPHLATVAGFQSFIERSKSAGTALAVATSAPEANIAFTLDGLGLRRHFDAVVGAADVKRGKPSPDVFLEAARRCGVAPQHCIAFEDAPLGVEAARNAGMQAVVLTTTMPADAFSAFGNVIAVVGDFAAPSLESVLVRTL